MRRYEEGLERWRRKAGPWILLLAAPFVVAGIWIHLAAPDSWQFDGGMALGAGIAIAMALWLSPPAYVENWKDGAEGEERTERALRPLEADGWTVAHDLAGSRGNRDHVVVGPGGVFLIDTKVRWGRVSIEGDRLKTSRLNDFDYRVDVGGPARRAAIDLHDEIGGWVHAVVAIWGDFPDRVVAGRDVDFVAGDQLADWLRSRPDRLTPTQIERAAARVRGLAPA
jgi:hypothetical protein